MMIEERLLVKILANKDIKSWERVKHYVGQLPGYYGFVAEYLERYGELPPLELVSQRCGLVIQDVPEDVDFLIDEVGKKILWRVIRDNIQQVANALSRYEPDKALEIIKKIVEQKIGTQDEAVRDIFDLIPDVLESYERARDGRVGILTPWWTLNKITLGFQNGSIYGFVGRTKKGKSVLMLYMAYYCWQCKKKVLFVSPEMPGVMVARRFICMHYGLDYERFRSGKMGDMFDNEISQKIKQIKEENDVPFWVITDVGDISVYLVENAIKRLKPDILFLDGIYLIRCWGEDLVNRMTNLADVIRAWARKYGLPIVFSTQFNRTISQNATTAEIRSVALSDRLAWNADAVFAVLQDVDLKIQKAVKILPLVVRDADADEGGFIINFDFSQMRFDEIIMSTPIIKGGKDDLL